jgi:transposase
MEKLEFDPPLDFGTMYAVRNIMVKTGIFSVLSILGKYRETAFFMIASRITHPGSDLSLTRLFSMTYYPWQRPMIKKDELYRCLDDLHSLKESIELGIFNTLNPDVSEVHYDLTSTYFEGREKNDLILFGYSRDKKRGKEQIVIGIVMADGIPIYHEVWPGNTVDPKTLESTLTILKERFHISNVIFIGDRAFGRNPSLNLLDRGKYITAAYRWDLPYRDVLMETDFSDGIVSDNLIIKEVPIDAVDIADEDSTEEEIKLIKRRRYIAVLNEERERLDLMDLEDRLTTIKRKMEENTERGELKKSLGELKSYVKFTDSGISLNGKRIEMMKKLAGRFLIMTNTELEKGEAVEAYKEQWRIERSFRTIKSFIEIRPVYHRKSERIRAHVFVAVLSLLVSRLIEKSLQDMTVERAAAILSGIKAIRVKSPMRMTYCSGSTETSMLLDRMGIERPKRILTGALPAKG